MEWLCYNKMQARQAKQNTVKSKLKSCVGCLFILHTHLTRASHPRAAFKHLILIVPITNTSEIARYLLPIYLNTTLVLRKRHFTYRLIAVHEALLRPSLRKAFISASPAEGLLRASRLGRGPARTRPEQTRYSNNYPRWVGLAETDRFWTDIFYA